MLHHFFKAHGLGETSVHLHADNCTGKNKNRYMMYYLMWPVLTGLHKEVVISFLPVGHTKFAPDWCFGLLKQRFRRTRLQILTTLPTMSLFLLQWMCRSWLAHWMPPFLCPCTTGVSIKTALKGITQMHHFRFNSSSPGVVFVESESSGLERKINLLKNTSWVPLADNLPSLIIPHRAFCWVEAVPFWQNTRILSCRKAG